jgi:hypothetical protein
MFPWRAADIVSDLLAAKKKEAKSRGEESDDEHDDSDRGSDDDSDRESDDDTENNSDKASSSDEECSESDDNNVNDDVDISDIHGVYSHKQGAPMSTHGGHATLGKTTKGKYVHAQQHHDYYFRPQSLIYLNLLEFSCLFKRSKKKLQPENGTGEPQYNMPDKKVTGSRKKNFAIEFDSGHPLAATHHLSLLSKQFTPIAAGAPRPTWNMWKKGGAHRRTFIKYYTTTFVPFWRSELEVKYVAGTKSAENYLQPNEFSALMKRWSKGSAVQRCRYYTFHNMVKNMNVSSKTRRISNKWAYRAVDKWADMAAEDVPTRVTTRNTGEKYDPATEAALDLVE